MLSEFLIMSKTVLSLRNVKVNAVPNGLFTNSNVLYFNSKWSPK